jgi:hypothetical protein
MKQFGTSQKPKYLRSQIARSNKLLSEAGYAMSHYSLIELHKEIDGLTNQLRSVESPQLAKDARDEYEAHQNADF